MKHVAPVKGGISRRVVHGLRTEHLTWCNFDIRSERQIEGRPIMLAYETRDDIDCARCITQLRQAINQSLKYIKSREIEKIAESLGVHDSATGKRTG